MFTTCFLFGLILVAEATRTRDLTVGAVLMVAGSVGYAVRCYWNV